MTHKQRRPGPKTEATTDAFRGADNKGISTNTFLRRLDALGVPLFTAPPSTRAGAEFVRPRGWQSTDAARNAETLDAWQQRPNLAICGVMGGRVAVVDVDTKNGADAAAVRASLDDASVRRFAEIRTPSGGWHYYVASRPDVPSLAANVKRGSLDLDAVEVLAAGRNAFLPGTRRPSYDGGGYVVVVDDLDELLVDDGTAFAAWVASHRRATAAAPDRPQASTSLPAVSPWLAERLRANLADVSGTAPGGRNDALNTAAVKLGHYVGAGYDRSDLEARLLEVALAVGLGEAESRAAIRSGLAAGQREPRTPPNTGSGAAGHGVLTLAGGRVDADTGEVLSEPQAPTGASAVTLATVTPELVSWLWPGYLPRGKLVVIDGDPSCGKSTLSTDLAARCSSGRPWPDGAPTSGPRDVLLLSAEDGLADTIAPRLRAARADLQRVHALTEVPMPTDDGAVRMVPPSLPRDIPTIRDLVERHNVALVVVDVLMAYLNGKVDSHRDQDVRGVLHQLASMADSTGCTVIMIRHLNKAGGGSPLYRGGGSIGIIGAARAAYIVGRDPDDPNRRILACTKLNLAPEPPALAYRLASDDTLGCARVEWEAGPVDALDAAALLNGPRDDSERFQNDEVSRWLLDFLSDNGGEASSADGLKAAAIAGFDRNLIQRTRARLGIKARKSNYRAGWVWVLPEAEELTPATEELTPTPPRNQDEFLTLTRKNSQNNEELTQSVLLSPQPIICTSCKLPMVNLGDGQTTHPGCVA